jgi:DnaJ-domain-containing protein 1
VDRDRLVLYLAAVFAGLTVLLAVAALATQPFLLLLALPFAATTYFLWYHATGRLAERARRRVEHEHARTRTRTRTQAAADAGPRDDWEWERDWERARRRATGPNSGAGARAGSRAGTGSASATESRRPPTDEAYRALDLEPGASTERVREAYREKVKEVHPDTETGDEEAFKRVNRAYEALTE